MVYHKLEVQWALILFLTLSFADVESQEVVKLAQDIHGTSLTTRNGRTISAYLGIPYAEPPIGPLRFAKPFPWKPRDGPIKANKHGNECPQLNKGGEVVGDEDCLFLNVYTPEISPRSPYPVMVYFHGGNFVRGSSEEAGPQYLLDRDIVLVTVNYRLGALGFLSTGDAAATGNFGLKDQALALQWVRMNIIAFGGNPNQVTIFGSDAGGVSTILLAISPTSQDLFDQYITQSGSPIAYWAFGDSFHDHYEKHAKDLGKYVNCPTGNSVDLVECLRSLDASTLVDSDHIFDRNPIWKFRTWSPTTEPMNLPGVFLTHSPGELLVFKEEWIKDSPAIVGYVLDEGLILTAELYANSTAYDSVLSNLDALLIGVTDNVAADGHPNQTATKVKEFYFDSVDQSDKEMMLRSLKNVITDSSFTFPIGLQMWMMGEIKSPYYVYRFDYQGSYSKTFDVTGNNDNLGVSHGDDCTYFFPLKNSATQLSESDEKMIDIMVDFWTSFATNGVPTSQSISDPNIWVTFIDQENRILIGNGSDPLAMSIDKPLEDQRLAFWNQIVLGELFETLSGR